MEYKIGQRILNINPDSNGGGVYKGQEATIVDIDDDIVVVQYNGGHIGRSDNPSRYYKIISSPSTVSVCGEVKTSIMLNIKEFVKNSFLSADEKAMREVGFKDSCGNYTSEARDFVINALCADKEADLISVATAILADKKANK